MGGGEDHFLSTEWGKAAVWIIAGIILTLALLALCMTAPWYVSTSVVAGSIVGLIGYVIRRAIVEQW